MINKIVFGKYEITKDDQSGEYQVYHGGLTLTLSKDKGEKFLQDLFRLDYLYFHYKDDILTVTQDERQLEMDEEEEGSISDVVMDLIRKEA